MPPSLALILWLVLLLALWRFDPAREPKTSLALWVPVIWMFIAASRLPSQWLWGINTTPPPEHIEEGSPLDRSIFLILILLAIAILVSRSFKWGAFVTRNSALMAFLCFALLSACWSDFPFVAFKRWFRDLGNYFVILVVLSDPRPLEAVRTVLRRLGYLLIPLSIVLVKYYPEIGRQYDYWLGTAMYVGPTTSKNMLGVLCLVTGLFFFWDTVTRWSDRKERRTKRIILVNIAFIAMTLWLLNLSDSATSRVCLLIGCMVVAAAQTQACRRRPAFLKVLIPATFLLYLIVAFGFGMMGDLAKAVGRNPTLTARTQIWTLLLSMHTNPLLGTGYGSFWLGPRFLKILQSGFGSINESHNGYLETYLNLGIIGLCLLLAFLIAGYRTICRRLKPFYSLSSFTLAVWTILIFYNVTEAAFQGGLLWMTLLPGALAVSERAGDRVRSVAAFENAEAQDHLPVFL
jgi:O-antigen ligase